MPLPIGFFMPLPLPIMIPFMMWQSAAIAAGFGTYFQFAKRRVSAMSNEEFNAAEPHQLVNSMYNDIVQQIPSSFAKVDSLTPVMLQSMNTMLDQAVKWLQGAITGNIFGTPNPVNETLPELDTGTGTDIAILNPNANEISSFSDTKIFDIFKNKMHLYSIEAQAVITTIYNIRILKSREKPPVNEPRVEIPTTPIPTGFLSTITLAKYPVGDKLIKAVKNSASYASAVSMLGRLWSNADFHCKNAREKIFRENNCRQKENIARLIVDLNKAVSQGLPFKL